MDDFVKRVLEYHERKPSGKIFTGLAKPVETQTDLAIAYSPGVAEPCKVIAENADESFRYTGRGNLVGVVTNGTAVLGLGNIGPYAAKPVMEGKAMLFKKYANIDVFDIELDCKDSDSFVEAVKALEPTLGGINLEDIKAPECFYIEERLREEMSIPVFHDDQHGTAIIASAAFLNALEVAGKKIEDVRVVFSGAGAAAIACASLFINLGARKENVFMCDSRGVIRSNRKDLDRYKARFAQDTRLETLADALDGADAFVGVSVAGVLSEEMIKPMAKNPIIFALANPDPEILPHVARAVRPDAIIATGRSDFPNQVNNVLGFPFIFRGALDVRATVVNEEMKLAAVKAIAALAKEDVPEVVLTAYDDGHTYRFGKDYLIPKPMDPRVLFRVAPAVAEAAMKSGVARKIIDIEDYHRQIEGLLGPTGQMIKKLQRQIVAFGNARNSLPKIAIPHCQDRRVLRAVAQVVEQGAVRVVLFGSQKRIRAQLEELGLRDFTGAVDVIDPLREEDLVDRYARELLKARMRKGVTPVIATQMLRNNNYFAAMMLRQGDVDGVVSGIVEPYAQAVRPLLQIVGTDHKNTLAGIYMIVVKNRVLFFADCTINLKPTSEQLAQIAIQTADVAKDFLQEPTRIALLSFASFGGNRCEDTLRVQAALKIVKAQRPDLDIDGEMQADVALNPRVRRDSYPFLDWQHDANVLVFPDLSSANISYKLLTSLSEAKSVGPLLVGMKKPANVLQLSTTSDEIANMIYVTANQLTTTESQLAGR